MKCALAVLCLSLCATVSWAQHQHGSTVTIDGAEHPELIPDATAYRLYFSVLSVPANPTELDIARQKSRIEKIGLEEEDRKQLPAIIADFSAKFEALVNEYNERATAAQARNERPDISTFLQQRDDLIRSTREILKRTLSADGVARFDRSVQEAKKNIKTTGGVRP